MRLPTDDVMLNPGQFLAAIKDPVSGRVFTGESWRSIADLLEQLDTVSQETQVAVRRSVQDESDNLGFVDQFGGFLSRDDTQSRYGFHDVEELQQMKNSKPELKDFKAAIKDPETGKMFTGPSHADAADGCFQTETDPEVKRRVRKALMAASSSTGFVDGSGTFFTREETKTKWGFKSSDELREMQNAVPHSSLCDYCSHELNMHGGGDGGKCQHEGCDCESYVNSVKNAGEPICQRCLAAGAQPGARGFLSEDDRKWHILKKIEGDIAYALCGETERAGLVNAEQGAAGFQYAAKTTSKLPEKKNGLVCPKCGSDRPGLASDADPKNLKWRCSKCGEVFQEKKNAKKFTQCPMCKKRYIGGGVEVCEECGYPSGYEKKNSIFPYESLKYEIQSDGSIWVAHQCDAGAREWLWYSNGGRCGQCRQVYSVPEELARKEKKNDLPAPPAGSTTCAFCRTTSPSKAWKGGVCPECGEKARGEDIGLRENALLGEKNSAKGKFSEAALREALGPSVLSSLRKLSSDDWEATYKDGDVVTYRVNEGPEEPEGWSFWAVGMKRKENKNVEDPDAEHAEDPDLVNLFRAIGLEQDAINIYRGQMEKARPHVKQLLQHIVDEEIHHIVEFKKQLEDLDRPLDPMDLENVLLQWGMKKNAMEDRKVSCKLCGETFSIPNLPGQGQEAYGKLRQHLTACPKMKGKEIDQKHLELYFDLEKGNSDWIYCDGCATPVYPSETVWDSKTKRRLCPKCAKKEKVNAADRTTENLKKLPPKAYALLPSSGELILIVRGESGYNTLSVMGQKGAKGGADELNRALGVTPAQAKAMFNGSMFGWGTKAADPDHEVNNASGSLAPDPTKHQSPEEREEAGRAAFGEKKNAAGEAQCVACHRDLLSQDAYTCEDCDRFVCDDCADDSAGDVVCPSCSKKRDATMEQKNSLCLVCGHDRNKHDGEGRCTEPGCSCSAGSLEKEEKKNARYPKDVSEIDLEDFKRWSGGFAPDEMAQTEQERRVDGGEQSVEMYLKVAAPPMKEKKNVKKNDLSFTEMGGAPGAVSPPPSLSPLASNALDTAKNLWDNADAAQQKIWRDKLGWQGPFRYMTWDSTPEDFRAKFIALQEKKGSVDEVPHPPTWDEKEKAGNSAYGSRDEKAGGY